jgi:hypothetical protein
MFRPASTAAGDRFAAVRENGYNEEDIAGREVMA